MIRNESEYRRTVKRLRAAQGHLDAQKAALDAEGLTPQEVKRTLDPQRSFYAQFEEETRHYERLKRGDLPELTSLANLGSVLVSLRIAQGMSLRELADRLGVHQSMLSRAERNEYHGITLARASKILDALGVRMRSSFEARR